MSRRRPPLSPEAAAVLRALTGSGSPATSGLSRRALLAGAGGLGLGAVLAACGTSGTATSPGGGGSASGSPSAGPSPAQDRSDTEKVVNWANWTLYLDKSDDGKHYPTLEAFTKQTGIKATYAEDIDDNDTYYGKIQAQLEQGQDIGKDVIVPHRLDGRPARSARATCRSSTTRPTSRTPRTCARAAERRASTPAGRTR